MTTKEKAAVFIAEYHQNLTKLNGRLAETADQLANINLEIRFIQEKELPEATQRRFLTGDRQQEKKVKKALDLLLEEQQEKNEDLLVLQKLITDFKLKNAADLQALFRLFQEEKRLAATEAHERMNEARKAYQNAILKHAEPLHEYRKTETELQQIEVNGGRRRYVETAFPIDGLKFASLAVTPDQISRSAKKL